MNRSSPLWLAGVVLAAAICGGFFFMAGGPDKSASQIAQTTPVKTPTVTSQPSAGDALSSGAVAEVPLSQAPATVAPVKTPDAKPQILETIQDAAVSYDAKELPKIQPFLLHPDPEVRAAALQGMIDLGDAAAAPLLRAASQLALSPEEALALKQAADYVELPSGSLLNKGKGSGN
ncbi:MAG TPA: hypothetical protein DCP71_03700 [Verrucomicrobiales bacterium]|nr:hypothetical protein [Verrucomicrobiales bacterium]